MDFEYFYVKNTRTQSNKDKKDMKIDSEFYSLFSALGLFYIFLIVFLIVFLLFLMAGVLGTQNYE